MKLVQDSHGSRLTRGLLVWWSIEGRVLDYRGNVDYAWFVILWQGRRRAVARGIQRSLRNYYVVSMWLQSSWCVIANLASLSIWSPKPGVSTIVNEIRVPSSSRSSSGDTVLALQCLEAWVIIPTDCDLLNLDALFEMGVRCIVCVFAFQDFLAAESVHECCSTWTISIQIRAPWVQEAHTSSWRAAHHQAELNTLLHILLPAHLYVDH